MGLFGGNGVLFSYLGCYVVAYRKAVFDNEQIDAIYVSRAHGLASNL
jgi:hypothetical protein